MNSNTAPAPAAEDESQESSTGYVEFAPPKGFQVPEGVQPGKEFDLVCSFKAESSGDLVMTKLGDTVMPVDEDVDTEETDQDEHKPGYGEYSQGMIDQMGAGAAGA